MVLFLMYIIYIARKEMCNIEQTLSFRKYKNRHQTETNKNQEEFLAKVTNLLLDRWSWII